jgi:hypothetical protein
LAQGEIEVLAGLKVGDKVVTDPVKAAIELKQKQQQISGRLSKCRSCPINLEETDLWHISSSLAVVWAA